MHEGRGRRRKVALVVLNRNELHLAFAVVRWFQLIKYLLKWAILFLTSGFCLKVSHRPFKVRKEDDFGSRILDYFFRKQLDFLISLCLDRPPDVLVALKLHKVWLLDLVYCGLLRLADHWERVKLVSSCNVFKPQKPAPICQLQPKFLRVHRLVHHLKLLLLLLRL